ncbi:MAG: hypothetical protein AAB815_03220 [Patescibacteria group bacterium]
MRKIIHHLRKQPEDVRTHILHIFTAISGVVLIFLWVYSLGANFSNPETQTEINNDLKPFSALKDNLVGGYKSISEPEPQLTSEIQVAE